MVKCLAYVPLLLLGFLNSTAKSVIKIFDAPLMPKKNLTIASLADVFGGMGSWNDDASGMVQYKKRGKEYEELSNELFTQMRKAILFAVNEW
ncbi:hypothetical protein [Campylobacter concisus]|uniref:hypothetical protein n=1 Tax=Campylobacter concisus TaxID=199 RepID=UPI001653018C|nr:hypothetical protein [Campylobacter concisus]